MECSRCGAHLAPTATACDNCGTATGQIQAIAVTGLHELLDENAQRWQYAVVNVGMFNSPDRMADTLSIAGANGWELVTVYDKASNWLNGMEKGFMLLKRPVPAGHTPASWCLLVRA